MSTPGPLAPITPARDVAKPAITRLTVSAARVSFLVSEASSVVFRVQRKTSGRRSGSKCVAQTKANRTKRACTRWVAVKGSLTIRATAGANGIAFRGRIGATTLKPGSYRLSAVATDAAGNTSPIASRGFRIAQRRT